MTKKNDCSAEYKKRAAQYARRGNLGLLLVAVPVALWSVGWISPLPWLLLGPGAGSGLLLWAREQLRCPSCEKPLPRGQATDEKCPHCEAYLGLPRGS